MDSHIIPSINSPILKTNWKSIYIVAIVAFITSLEYAATNDWNYFCQLDPSATITFYGILRTVGGLSGGISTILAGGGSMSRTHVAMASTEKDRDKAIALTSLLPAVGLLVGFAINAGTSYMKYPGIEIPLIKIHLNLFTAPMIFSIINPPYQQLAFQWDASQLQFYSGLSGVAMSFQLILWPAAYMLFGLNKIISERQSVMLGLIVLIGGYLLTFSWPFLSETFPYSLNSSPSLLSSLLNNKTEIIENISNCGSESRPGCPSHYEWCGTTTK
uniref:Uncharacterized protein n=1 Tax=Meloidogyne javanica TaxID=6303 RepID=A0A915N9D3_MELJA